MPPPTTVNRDVRRTVDISEQIASVAMQIEVVNNGAADVSEYIVAIHPSKAGHLAWLSAKTSSSSHKRLPSREVRLRGAEEDARGARFFRVKLRNPVQAGQDASLYIDMVFTHVMRALPEEISQSETQSMEYLDSAYVYSVYTTERQSLTLDLASDLVHSFTRNPKPARVDGDQVKYGTYGTRVRPFSTKDIRVHFENDTPFATFTSMVREIEVSHWGNVAIIEHYKLFNDGAKLTGGFSRLDYDGGRGNQGGAAFHRIRALLPRTSYDVYYRDEIGNISSSNLRVQRKSQLFELQPRFPMMGGWKTEFTVGYNVLSHELLSRSEKDPSKYILDVDFSTPFDNVVVDHAEIRIIVPEGAQDLEFRTPFTLDAVERGRRATYLDTIGRPMLQLKKSHLVSQHKQRFQVTYRFSSVAIYREPMLLVTGFMLLNLAFIFLGRIDLSIDAHKNE